MVALPIVTTPAPPGVLARVGAYIVGTGIANLDVDDLEVTIAPPGPEWRRTGDDLAIDIIGDHPGPDGLAVTIASAELDVDVLVGVLPAVVDPLYGAAVAGVEALVTNLTLTYATNPSTADVAGWLVELGQRVAARIGPLDELDADVAELLTTKARGVVHLGAAAYTEDAAHPERITKQGDDRYGAILWARFTEGLNELAELVDRERGADDLDPLAGRQHAGASFPAPMFRRDANY